MARTLRVKNFTKFQHYKHRSPPWIKLHRGILDDYHFTCLQDASKLHLVCIWVLASQLDNDVPDDPTWIARRIGATEIVDVESLVSAGFLERYVDGKRASTALATRVQNADSEAETEKSINYAVPPSRNATDEVAVVPVPPADPADNWPAAVADRWTAQVGVIAPGRVGKDLKPVYRQFGLPILLRAVDSFAYHRRLAMAGGNEKPDNWPQFVRDFTDYVPKTVLAAMRDTAPDANVGPARGKETATRDPAADASEAA